MLNFDIGCFPIFHFVHCIGAVLIGALRCSAQGGGVVKIVCAIVKIVKENADGDPTLSSLRLRRGIN
jgi:hypothetical protein